MPKPARREEKGWELNVKAKTDWIQTIIKMFPEKSRRKKTVQVMTKKKKRCSTETPILT